MNKPVTMSHKEWIIKQLSLKLVISEKVIDTVVNNQFDGALEVLGNKNSIELSGFGKFVYNEARAKSYLKKYYNQLNAYTKALEQKDISATDIRRFSKKLETAKNNIKLIRFKLKMEEE